MYGSKISTIVGEDSINMEIWEIWNKYQSVREALWYCLWKWKSRWEYQILVAFIINILSS
jgi:hypothetical protein